LISSKTDETTAREAVTILEEVVKEKMIKWMFIFWLGQIAVLSGIIFVFMKLYFRQ
jgi:hypothetical protein